VDYTSAAEVPPSKPEFRKIPDLATASIPDTLTALRVNIDTGLTQAEVTSRWKSRAFRALHTDAC